MAGSRRWVMARLPLEIVVVQLAEAGQGMRVAGSVEEAAAVVVLPHTLAELVVAEGRQAHLQALNYHSALWAGMNAGGGSTEALASSSVAVAVEGRWTTIDAVDTPQDHSAPVERMDVLPRRLTSELGPEFEGRCHSAD